MQTSFKKNYIQIYIWRSLSLVVGFISLFIVIPYLSSNKEIYGIYTFCASFQLYLSYADIGFLSAGQKYSAEFYARENKRQEVEILGFVGFILLCMILPFSVLMFVFAINPNMILNGISSENIHIIRLLFVILAVVSPVQVLFQRVAQSILVIRVKDYISSRIDIAGNIIKILSVLFFFTRGRYMIVEYFFFINIVTLLCSVITIYMIKKYEDYDFWHLLLSIKWSKKYFNLMKKMAFTSLGLSVSWIVCYELDLIYIGNLFTVVEVAHYSVCLSVINFIRNLSNIIYGPYAQRFNHFVALNDDIGFSRMLTNITRYTFPLMVFISIILFISAYYFILFWVGANYLPSVPIMQVLALFFIMNFASQPASYACMSKEMYKVLNFSALSCPLVFFLSLVVLYRFNLGIISFAMAKLIMSIWNSIIYVIVEFKWINVLNTIKPYVIPTTVCVALLIWISKTLFPLFFANPEKSSLRLLCFITTIGILGIFFVMIIYPFDISIRTATVKKIKLWIK